MAQLRDAQTSQYMADGSPDEMVLLAEEIGRAEVLFDGVGLAFDPAATLASHRDRVIASKRPTDGLAAEEKEQVAKDAADLAALAPSAKRVDDAGAAMRGARALVRARVR
jgi:hypothetical protein